MAAHADGGGSNAAYDDSPDGGATADGAPAAAGAPESISQEPINVLFASTHRWQSATCGRST